MTQLNRVFSAPIGDLLGHLQDYHFNSFVLSGKSNRYVWEISEVTSKKAIDCFGHIFDGLKNENLEENYIWYILYKNSEKMIDKIMGMNVVRITLPSIIIRPNLIYCDELRSKTDNFLHNLIFNKIEKISFGDSCECVHKNYDIAENYFSSFLYFLNSFKTVGNFEKLFIALLAEDYTFSKVKNLIQIIHHILPSSYEMQKY